MDDFFIFILLFFCIFLGYAWGILDQKRKNNSKYNRIAKLQHKMSSSAILEFNKEKEILDFMRKSQNKNSKLDNYLLLGNMFRYKGEFDKSIKLYYQILADLKLESAESWVIRLELAKSFHDYGLLDRAEKLLLTIIQQQPKRNTIAIQALEQLIKLYEHEQEWLKAINITKRLIPIYDKYCSLLVAQFYCELGSSYLEKNQQAQAHKVASEALYINKNSVRASLLLANIEFARGNYNMSIKSAERIKKQDIRFISLAVPILEKAHENVNSYIKLQLFYQECLLIQSNSSIALSLAKIIIKEKNKNAAANFLVAQLKKHPTLKSLRAFIKLKITESSNFPELKHILNIVESVIKMKPVFSCLNCGFSAKTMYWQCPSCNKWEQIVPTQGIEGE